MGIFELLAYKQIHRTRKVMLVCKCNVLESNKSTEFRVGVFDPSFINYYGNISEEDKNRVQN